MNRNGEILYGDNILSIAKKDNKFQNMYIVKKFNEDKLKDRRVPEDENRHNCFCDTVKELYPELFGNMETEDIRFVLAYGLYLFQKKDEEKRFLIQDFEELLVNGREVEINVGIAALKGLCKDLYVILPIGNKKALVGLSKKNSDYPSILSSDEEVNKVLNNEEPKENAKIAEFYMDSEPNAKGKIVCGFQSVKNNSELKGQISGYESNAKALEVTIANVKLPNEGDKNKTLRDRVNEILGGCTEKDKCSMSLILLEGIIAQNNWEKEKKVIASKSVSKDAQKMSESKIKDVFSNTSNLNNSFTETMMQSR